MSENVRRGTASDVRALVRLHASCSPATIKRRFLTPVSTLTVHEAQDLLVPAGGFSLVAEIDGALAGLITVTPDEPETVAFAGLLVADRYQRRGIGTTLLHAAIRDATRDGFDELYLTVLPDNTAVMPMIGAAGVRARVATRDGLTRVTVPLRSVPSGIASPV